MRKKPGQSPRPTPKTRLAPPPDRPSTLAAGAGHRRIRTAVLVGALAVAALGLGWFAWGWATPPAPPAVSYADVDPVVADAIEAARREVWWKPHSAAAWGRLGLLLCADGVRPEANRCFARAEQLAPDDPRWPYLQGYALRLDDPEAAVRHLQRAVALCGTTPDGPALTLAEVSAQQGRLDDADGLFRRVLQNHPDNARAHLGLGRLALERGDPRAALPHLQRAADSERTRKAAAAGLTQAYHQLGDPAAAGAQARAAELPTDPPWPDPFLDELPRLVGKQARLARLKALYQQGRTAEARELARQIEDDYPDVYWLVEGRQQMEHGNLAAAEQALRKAAELAPASVDAHFDLGTVLYRRQDYPAAAASFRTVAELQPDYGPAYLGLGHCAAAQGDRATAVRAFREAVRLLPHSAEAHRELGDWLAREGRATEAAAHLRQALQLNPQDAHAQRLLEDVSRRLP